MKKSLNGLSKTAFWDVDFERLDLEKDANLIVPKVFNYGLHDDIVFVLHRYGKKRLQSILTQTSYLTVDTLWLASIILDIIPSRFACYKNKQLRQQHWPY